MPTPKRYFVPEGRHRTEQTFERSRFITTLGPAPTVEAAQAAIGELRDEFPGATHTCWAYQVGAPGQTDRVGASDDGEPAGTAGRPILAALGHSGLGDIWAVVTRFYGGTKLGTGGLVRAYGGGVRHALESLPSIEKIPRKQATAIIPYNFLKTVQRLLAAREVLILEEHFELDITFVLSIPIEHMESFERELLDATHGESLYALTTTATGDQPQ